MKIRMKTMIGVILVFFIGLLPLRFSTGEEIVCPIFKQGKVALVDDEARFEEKL